MPRKNKRKPANRFKRIWNTKNKDDEWWSSFFASPLAVAFNYLAVDVKWLTPNGLTLMGLAAALAAGGCMLYGGSDAMVLAAVLIQASLVLDCMDGQMAKYRGRSSAFGAYFDKVSDQIKIFVWFAALAYAAFQVSKDVTAVFLAFTGVSFYYLRVYVKYLTLYMEAERDPRFLSKSAKIAAKQKRSGRRRAGLGAGFAANLGWLIREQRKFFLFNEAVLAFLLSLALLSGWFLPVLWLFAVSQVFYGLLRAFQRGHQIYFGRHAELLKPVGK